MDRLYNTVNRQKEKPITKQKTGEREGVAAGRRKVPYVNPYSCKRVSLGIRWAVPDCTGVRDAPVGAEIR